MLQAERGASKNTLAAYGADLDHVMGFLARRKQGPLNADAEGLRAYLKSLDYVGMTPRTVARRLSVIRQFFRFLLAERLREGDPAAALDSPKLGRPLPKVLSRAEVDALIAAMLEAREHPAFVSAVRALDRTLISGFYAIPLFNIGEQWIARWNRIERPKATALTGYLPETWWYRKVP